jgi:hypothetical protein
VAGRCITLRGMTRHYMTWHGTVYRATTLHGTALHGVVFFCVAWHYMTWYDTKWHDTAWHDTTLHGTALHGIIFVCYSMAWQAWHGMAWQTYLKFAKFWLDTLEKRNVPGQKKSTNLLQKTFCLKNLVCLVVGSKRQFFPSLMFHIGNCPPMQNSLNISILEHGKTKRPYCTFKLQML